VNTQERRCKVCPAYGQTPVHWEYPHVCESCRGRMRRHLTDITEQWWILDATPGGSNTEKVSGSREAPIGARVDVLDQVLPVTALTHEPIRANIPDQIGSASTATVLDAIALEWLDTRRARGLREHRPVPTVANLCAWLTDRLDWACERLPDSIDSHALELKQLVGRLYALNGNTRSREAEPLPATPCKWCAQIALVRYEGTVICTNCSQYSGAFADAMADALTHVTQQAA
jgi:hypothetical protein